MYDFEKVNTKLEIVFKTGFFFSSNCFLFKLINKSYKKKMQEFQVQNEIRTIMTGSISHELRTPLNGLINFIE